MFLEIELKLTIDPAHIALLIYHPLLKPLNPAAEELISRYFDTADLRLWRQGLSLRTRETGGHTIQTLKTAGEQIGELHHRHEWDQPITGKLPIIHGFEDKEVSKKLDGIIDKQPLIELFHTRFNRTQWNINCSASKRCNSVEFEANARQVPELTSVNEYRSQAFNDNKPITALGSTQIELVLDQGVVSTGQHHMPIHEIELELKQGDANQLYKVAEILKQTIPLTLETRSKAQRGYLLYTDNNLSAVCT